MAVWASETVVTGPPEAGHPVAPPRHVMAVNYTADTHENPVGLATETVCGSLNAGWMRAFIPRVKVCNLLLSHFDRKRLSLRYRHGKYQSQDSRRGRRPPSARPAAPLPWRTGLHRTGS